MTEQLDLFAAAGGSSSIEATRRYGRMDALCGFPRLNEFRLKQAGEWAAAYDDGYRAGVAEMQGRRHV